MTRDRLLLVFFISLGLLAIASQAEEGDCDDTLKECLKTMPVVCNFIKDHRLEAYEKLSNTRHTLHQMGSLDDLLASRVDKTLKLVKEQVELTIVGKEDVFDAYEKEAAAEAIQAMLTSKGCTMPDEVIKPFWVSRRFPSLDQAPLSDYNDLRGLCKALDLVEELAAKNRAALAAGEMAAYEVEDLMELNFYSTNEAPLSGVIRTRSFPEKGHGVRPPTAGDELDTMVTELFAWLNSKAFQSLSPLEQAAMTYLHVSFIDPFQNGFLTSHLAATLVLRSNGIPFFAPTPSGLADGVSLSTPAKGHGNIDALTLAYVDGLIQYYNKAKVALMPKARLHDEL